jgi:hypothetical protein
LAGEVPDTDATPDGVTNKRKDKPEPTADQKLAEELVARAREQGVSLPSKMLQQRDIVIRRGSSSSAPQHADDRRDGLSSA